MTYDDNRFGETHSKVFGQPLDTLSFPSFFPIESLRIKLVSQA